ncbi:hybrid sensor histidine kinase/response regulator [Candidatus Leptofilum sp.]|uniref:hybrid sensor histidine kinase/response regulator n=1 Tax=Candidatus Leptofilum sp. TaxID=3241576 RepID=UPI003B592239
MQNLTGSILVVDDNAVIRQIMKMALEQNGHHVTLAEDGREALELMHAHFFDLVLLDIVMPHMSGFDVLEHMAQIPDLANIPVIVVSSDNQIESAIRCIQLGAEDYLVKPPNQTLLRTRVNTSLRKKKLHDQELAHQAEMERLYEAIKEANAAKTEFIAMAAHELRNPIAQIATTNHLLGKVGALNKPQEGLLEKVNFSLERMQALIVDLDDISRLEAGNIRLQFAELDLAELIDKIAESFSEDVTVHQHVLAIDVPENLPPIWADYQRMIQVFTNLIGNAIKYTPDGGNINIKATYLPEHRTVHVSVTDTGLGIHPDERKQIFSKFFRSENAKVRARPGTGLGLYITKSLVEMQNGRIWFESEFGEGTQFHLMLPEASAELDPQTAEAPIEAVSLG